MFIMNTAAYTIISVVGVSLISLVSLILISRSSEFIRRYLRFLVSFAAGALLGDVFIHLLPEMAEEGILTFSASLWILGTIVAFFVLESFLHWHHHHGEGIEGEHAPHPFVWTNLIGDGFHNIIDGMIIAGAYMISFEVGLATTIAVMLHEIPQEIGDFGVLVYGGLTRSRALFYNFLSALSALVGAVIVLALGSSETLVSVLSALGIGSFIYIAAADLIPHLHREKEKAFPQFLTFLLGIVVMALLLLLE